MRYMESEDPVLKRLDELDERLRRIERLLEAQPPRRLSPSDADRPWPSGPARMWVEGVSSRND